MNKLFGAILAFIVLMPLASYADSYDGPFCYEAPSETHGVDDVNHVRGSCKFVDVSTSVTLDPSLQSTYLLGTHWPIQYGSCDVMGCEVQTKFSEIITLANTTTLQLPNEDLFANTNGQPNFHDDVVLLDKAKILAFSAGRNVSQLVILDKNEFNPVSDDPSVLSEAEIFKAPLAKGADPVVVTDSPITGTSTALYTYHYLDLGSAVQSLKNPYADNLPRETTYIPIDSEKPANVGLTETYGYKGRFLGYTVPVTNPVKSVKQYWAFVPKGGSIVFAWQKTEYTFTDGSTKTETSSSAVSHAPSTVAATTSTETQPTTEKLGFLAALWKRILSWFR